MYEIKRNQVLYQTLFENLLKMKTKTKRCSKCSILKSVKEFHADRQTSDGLSSGCKVCKKEYQQSDAGRTVQKRAKQRYNRTDKGKTASRKADRKRYNAINGYLKCIYAGLDRRCNNPKDEYYENCGGRGIKLRFTLDELRHYVKENLGIINISQIKGLEIDRINLNGHYEPGNIKFITYLQKRAHSRKHRTWRGQQCSSKFKGVSWDKRQNKWRAYITVNYKVHFLGYYVNEIDSARAYDIAAKKYFGKYAHTNADEGLL